MWSEGSRTPPATSISSTMGSTANTIYIHQKHGACSHTIFQRQIDLNWSQRDKGWSWCYRTPSATSTSSIMASTESTSYVQQKLTWHMFIYYFSKINRFKIISRWSRCSRTPSATSTSSSWHVLQVCSSKYDMAHVLIYYFSKTKRFKLIQAWYMVIKIFLDTFSDLDKLNHRKFRKYQLCTSNIDMTHVYILFFKDKSI